LETLLEVKNIKKYFPVATGTGLLRRKYATCKAVDDVTFSVKKGACFGIAGESGSGKSTVAKLILHMEKLSGGSILFEGTDTDTILKQDPMWYRSRVQTIFQDAASSLDPRMRIRDIVAEPLQVQNRNKLGRKEIYEKAQDILSNVGLAQPSWRKYPHEMSGGQKQRAAIARAMIIEPALVILDEPVSALDVSIRAQILNLLADIQERQGLTYIIIAHDLAMMQHVTTQIAVMYLGRIVEIGETSIVFSNPLHPYTRGLFAAVPLPEPGRIKKSSISGEIANPINPPSGCHFHPRCSQASERCRKDIPALVEIEPGHYVSCLLTKSQ
jgi:oligopeptide/dipeptide ABC transporter ATP-binding protein